MALQRVRSLATTKFIDENTANAYIPAAGEMISIFVHGTYRGLRIGDGTTAGGLSLVNTDLAELYEYIGEAPPEEEVVLPTPDTGTDTTPVVDTVPQTWAQQQAEQLGEATVASELFDATFYGMNSLYFDGDSHLSRTFGTPTDQYTYTFSGWFKKEKDKTEEYLFTAYNGSNTDRFQYLASNEIGAEIRDGGSLEAQRTSTGYYVDPNSFTHIVFSVSNAKNLKIYVDGSELTDLRVSSGDIGSTWSGGLNVDDRLTHIGAYASDNDGAIAAGYNFTGRIANIQFIDGMALDSSYFGQYMGANWVPKVYNGAYGANGFHLEFNRMRGLGLDVGYSGNVQWNTVDSSGYIHHAPPQEVSADGNAIAIINDGAGGSGNHLTVTLSEELSGDFTLETWIARNGDRTGSNQHLFEFAQALFYHRYYNSRLSLWDSSLSSNQFTFNSFNTGYQDWEHVAFVRKNGIVSAYLNGINAADTESNSGNMPQILPASLTIGDRQDAGLNQIRISNVARYTENFDGDLLNTTTNFVPDSNTLLYIKDVDTTTVGSATFIDSSESQPYPGYDSSGNNNHWSASAA